MIWTRILGAGAIILAAALYYVAVRSARRHHWNPWILRVLTAVSGIGLVAMVLTDWPGERLAHFWADHSILATVVSTVLLVSLGYVAFEAEAIAEQNELDRSVASAGLSGLVDHLIDVDIALAMISDHHPPTELESDGRPLRWIRPIRERLQTSGVAVAQPSSKGASEDPQSAQWRVEVVDQCIRRIIAGMRDWAALISVSDDGRRALKHFGELRIALLLMQEDLDNHGEPWRSTLGDLRKRFQRFAIGLECVSSRRLRPGLTNFMPGGMSTEEIDSFLAAMKHISPPSVGKLLNLLK